MPHRCCVPKCKGNYDSGPKVATFGFPKNLDLRNKWILAIKREHFTPSKSSRVCELHFETDVIERKTTFTNEATGEILQARLEIPRLVAGAIPSKLPECPSYSSKDDIALRESSNTRRRKIECRKKKRAIGQTKADKRLKAIKAPAHSLQHQQQVVTTVNRANKFTIAKLVNGATSTSQASSLQASTSSTHALPISEGDIKIEIEEEKLFDPSSREYIEYPNTAKRARIEDDTTNVPTICSVKQEIEDATEDQDLVEAIEVKKEPGDDEPDVADYLSVAQIKMEIGDDFVE